MKFFILIFTFISNVYAQDLKDFELPTYSSNEIYKFSAKNLKNKLVINFWATWCTSCIQEIPLLEKLKADNPTVEFIAISAGDKPNKIKKFIEKHKFTYKILMDSDNSFSKSIRVINLPQTMVIEPGGKIIYHKEVPPEKL